MTISRTRYLVTGGAGFIGSHLCAELLRRGCEVICVDNFYTGHKDNIKNLFHNPYFEVLRHDIGFPLYVEVDAIFNLACPASPIHYQFDPVQTLKTNVTGSIHMLGLAKRLGVRVLQASTSEVYGDPEVHPQSEWYKGNVNFTGPRACYDEGKRCAETAFFDYYRQHNIEIRVARIFNTYGPRMNVGDGRVVSNFVWQALRGMPVTIYGDGKQTRSFCYVDDMVDGLIRLMESDSGAGMPVNLGNPEESGIGALAEIVARHVGNEARVVYNSRPADDPARRCPDIGRANEVLGWYPTIALEDGIRETVEYFRQLTD